MASGELFLLPRFNCKLVPSSNGSTRKTTNFFGTCAPAIDLLAWRGKEWNELSPEAVNGDYILVWWRNSIKFWWWLEPAPGTCVYVYFELRCSHTTLWNGWFSWQSASIACRIHVNFDFSKLLMRSMKRVKSVQCNSSFFKMYKNTCLRYGTNSFMGLFLGGPCQKFLYLSLRCIIIVL